MHGLLVAAIFFASCLATPDAMAQKKGGDLTDEEVTEAIEKIKKYFYDTQDPKTGGWFGAHHQALNDGAEKNWWGPSSMAALALIVSGESPQKPEIAKALDLLQKVDIKGVYALSMRTHLWSYLPRDVYGGSLAKDADEMLRSSYGKSRFNYETAGESGRVNQTRIDNSTTQYGVLAMWQASKSGLNIPDKFWADALSSFFELQSDDGGWGYSGKGSSKPSMTLAGLTVMYVGQQELFRDQSKPNAKVQESIEKGLAYLDKNFSTGGGGAHGGAGYTWYGYERVALANGRKYFGGKDWYQEIAKVIINKNAKYGDSIHEAAFHLMFLARGRVPVWINKLKIEDADWNNRPNDIYFLNRWISEFREHEVNWQVSNIKTDPKDWISAPLMWLSTDKGIEWTDDYANKIKQYLDMGGTLVVNPEESYSQVRDNIEELANKIYPDLKFQDLSSDHPIANLLIGDPRQTKAPPIRVLSNGPRVLMILPDDDWGMSFQKDKKPNPDRNEDWKYIANIYGVVSDRGQLTPRLTSTVVEKKNRPSTGTIKVVIPKWEDKAGHNPEHDVYMMMRNYMHNETGKQLVIEELPLSELGKADPSLLHMVGYNKVAVTDAEREAVKKYIDKGGTVLVENLGGTGEFAASVREQFDVIFSAVGAEERVGKTANIISGRTLPEGNKNNRRVIYRRLVLERANPDSRLLLRGYVKGDRIPVLLTYEDLSLGMLGVKQFGINGYSVETSRDMMLNILLEANQAYPGSTTPTPGANKPAGDKQAAKQ